MAEAAGPLSRWGKEAMHEEVWINYYGREIAVTKEVADYLEKSRKEMRSSDRRYRRWNSPLSQYVNPDRLIAPKLHAGNDPMLNRLILKERRAKVQEAVSALSVDMRRLFYLRYVMEMTQQQIGDREGVSKMAICKRLKKLHKLVQASIPDWVGEEYLEEL